MVLRRRARASRIDSFPYRSQEAAGIDGSAIEESAPVRDGLRAFRRLRATDVPPYRGIYRTVNGQ